MSLSSHATQNVCDVHCAKWRSVFVREYREIVPMKPQRQKVRRTTNQVLKAYSFSLDDAASSAAAFEYACLGNGGRCPDAVFLCAGASRPGFFVEETEASLRSGMDNGYWVQAWSALVSQIFPFSRTSTILGIKAAAKRMARDQFPGKIVFVSSVLGYMSIVGYSSYAPAKFALRGAHRNSYIQEVRNSVS